MTRVAGTGTVSVQAHLATVRGRYRAILRDNSTRDVLYGLTPADAAPSDRKAFVDELLERLRNAIDPETAPVQVKVRQDVPDAAQVRLTAAQASALLNAPGCIRCWGCGTRLLWP